MITHEQLVKCGVGKLVAEKFLKAINATMQHYNINTPLRIAHFIAQVLHESGNFFYVREIASGAAYEGRKDLGNTVAGDGIRFRGRGLIQITGRANYTTLAKELGLDCVNHPEVLELPINACMSAGWFWNKSNLNKYADLDDIKTITKRINGGTNGMADRLAKLDKIKSALGIVND